MKTIKILLTGVAVAVIVTAQQNLWATDGASQIAKIKQNNALVHSPRMIELFPELAISDVTSSSTYAKPDIRANKMNIISRNLSLVHSPRVLEQFPELAFSVLATGPSQSAVSTNEFTKVLRSRSLAQSPKMIERFPVLRLKQ